VSYKFHSRTEYVVDVTCEGEESCGFTTQRIR
jgi:hypothetical protein